MDCSGQNDFEMLQTQESLMLVAIKGYRLYIGALFYATIC